jgi:hypothetical protein
MHTTIHAIDELSGRIQRAYERQRPLWLPKDHTTHVWSAAASRLLEARQADTSLPLDPELFVASQPCSGLLADPWRELTQTVAIRRYRVRVRRIVMSLRRELVSELRWSRERLRNGDPIEVVLTARNPSLSALGRFLVASRAGRRDLADIYRLDAQAMHRTCPLYRQACNGLLPQNDYPVFDPIPGLVFDGQAGSGGPVFSLN